MKKRNIGGFVVLLMAVVGVVGALAGSNRPRATVKTETQKSAASSALPRPSLAASASSLAAPRTKRQTSGNSVTVTHTNDGGPGSLRQAINQANNVPGTTIVFNIPTSDPGFDNAAGVFVIRPLSPLPTISGDGTVMDGVSQTVFTGDTNPVGPEIVINGGLAGASATGLHIQDADNCVIRGLVINGFALSGISINGTGAVNNRVNECFIGTNEKGAAAVSNSIDGIVITDGAHNNLIGGGNLISGNGQNGIVLAGAGVIDNRVQGNVIGLNLAGDAALGNARHGILITNGAQENVIGGTTPLLDGNIISGNGEDGVHISGGGTDDNVVRNSCIGGNRNRTGMIPNGGDGVEISAGAQGNEVGDATNDLGNVIFGNGGNGVLISDNNTTMNRVQRCAIGTNPDNEMGVGGNVLNGVLIANGASNNLIGGPDTNQGCVISGNWQNGVRLTRASNNVVQGNFIGTNISGTASLSNAQHGVLLDNGASNNQIGGATTRARNVISGNTHGVSLVGNTTTGNVVQGNFIGTDVNGTADLGNEDDGVHIENAANNLIGGGNAGEGNVISGNDDNGVRMDNGTSNTVQGNLIGTDVSGAAALGNSDNGVLMIESSQNVIGGAASSAGNRIAHNGLDGVIVAGAAATQNRILSNLIHDNGGLGIDLIGGVEDLFHVTANDPSDADSSPNKLQNFPVLTFAQTDGNFTTVKGSLDSDPANAAYPVLIQFFVSGAADPSGFGEGEVLFASHVLNAPGNFSLNNLPPPPVGAILTATATDSDGNTSEFSQAIPVSAMSAGVAHLSIGATPSVVAVDGEAVIEVQATNSVGNAVSNANVVFQTTGGTLNANADTTDANGRAKVILRQVPFGATTVTAETGSVRATVEVKGVLRLRVPAGVSLLSFPVDVAAGQVGAVGAVAVDCSGTLRVFLPAALRLKRGTGLLD